MIRFAGTVVYRDGRTERYEIGTRGVIAWEDYARRHGIAHDPANLGANSWTMLSVLACLSVTGTLEGYAAWLDTIDGIDPDLDEPATVPPTLREATAG